MTLEEGQQLLKQNIDQGMNCPCCGQFAKQYRRKLNSFMAYALILIDRHFRTSDEWLHVPSYLVRMGARDRECAKLRYWGLLQEMEAVREDNSPHAGYYRITEEGKAFVRGEYQVPRYVHLYDNRVSGYTGEPIGIKEALGDHFRYDELMKG